jgi:hypothetical protein
LPVFAANPAAVEEGPEMPMQVAGAGAQFVLQGAGAEGRRHEQAEDGDPPGVAQSMGDGHELAIPGGVVRQGGAQGLQKRSGGHHLRVGAEAIEQVGPPMVGLEKSARLDAAQLLAGVGNADSGGVRHGRDILPGVLVEVAQELDARGAGQHPAGAPEGGVERLHAAPFSLYL